MIVTRAGEPVALTPTELRLIHELAEHAGQVLSRHQLLHRVWGYGYAGDSRLVDAVVQRHLPLLLRGVPVLDADPPTESRVLLVRDVPDDGDPAGGGEGCLQPLAVLDRPQIGERNPFDSGGRSYGGCFSAQ